MANINCVIVLAPNGRKQKVKVTPNTTILQILEEVCQKQELRPQDYGLKHHNHILDTTVSLRYSGLPNNAQLEMTKLQIARREGEVIVSLVYESGERSTGTFLPSESLWDIVVKFGKNVSEANKHPVVIYMHQHISGVVKLQDTTLRALGLTSGRAMLRLVHRPEEEASHQANVTTLLPHRPVKSAIEPRFKGVQMLPTTSHGPSGSEQIKNTVQSEEMEVTSHDAKAMKDVQLKDAKPREQRTGSGKRNIQQATSPAAVTKEKEKEENEVVLGERNAIAFSLSMAQAVPCEDLPEDFFDLTLDDVRSLFRDLRSKRSELENAPLQTTSMRDTDQSKRVKKYVKTVIRVQFPDRTVLQGIFTPMETFQAVSDFIRGFLENPSIQFHLYTTPPKVVLSPSMTLIDAKCVPNAVIHFGPEEAFKGEGRYLRPDVFANFSSLKAATMAASRTRSISDAEPEDKIAADSFNPLPSTSKACTSYPSDSDPSTAFENNSVPSTSKASNSFEKDPVPSTSKASTSFQNQVTGKDSPVGKVPKWFKTANK